jgi:hypothetical protein
LTFCGPPRGYFFTVRRAVKKKVRLLEAASDVFHKWLIETNMGACGSTAPAARRAAGTPERDRKLPFIHLLIF